ncbi:MAG TPA: helix-turn-helix domain-containing protein [Actinomycetota bacterium]|nr:helix-turn-helix domain-containing protein [Actinomycetota bacterium]
MLMQLSVMEQPYRAVMEVRVAGLTVTEVAEMHEVSRKTVHEWINRYRAGGMPAFATVPTAQSVIRRSWTTSLRL